MNLKILKKAFSFVFSLFLIISFVSCSKGDCNTDAVISTYTQATTQENEITTTLESDTIASTEKDTTEDITVIVPIETEITEIPIINIVTDDGKEITSKSEYKHGKMSISCDEKSGFDNCTLENIGINIRGRGNASWNQFPKKAYRIKLDESCSILGLKKDKDWVLVSSYPDKTLMRNVVAHEMAKQLEYLEYTPTHILIELYLNGEYRGVYTIAEKIEFGGGKLEYEADKSLENTSYLMEVGWDYNDKMIYGQNYFDTGYIERIVIKEPDFESRYTPSGNYIINYMKKAEKAVTTLNGYEEFIDVDSLIDFLIITEFTNNTEAVFYRSCYMYKPSDGKLKFGPVWDFDMAFGNHTSDIRGYNGWCGVDNTFSYLGKNGKTWYHFLFKDPNFTSRFAERWDEVKDTLLQTALDTIDTQYKAVLGAQTRNFDRWDILNKKIGAGNVDHRTYNTFDLQVEYLREFINTRYNWIDENISEFRLQ
jgi:hypothetical protein